mmetsp:Transcript_23448/g.76235  ORF Transcript_23448/g.76235 Transcript_23448/m.76235 type:complete len:569 (-) Transcript_23448:3064-4770(-)
MIAQKFLLLLYLLLLLLPRVHSSLGLSGGQSSVSFCVTDKSTSQLFYLTDLTSPLLGQTLSEEQFSQGKLILGGGVLPDFKLQLLSADNKYVVEDNINWSFVAHRRQIEYFNTIDRMTRDAALASSSYLSVVPIGLAGASNQDPRQQTSLPDAQRSMKPTRDNEPQAFAPRVPRLWPTIADAIRKSSKMRDEGGGGEERVTISSISRFVVSLLRYKVRVMEEETHYMSSVNLQEMRRKSQDAHPDLREGQLRADLPHSYVSEIHYGHRLLVSANVSLAINPSDPPLESSHIAHNLMRVVAKELSASTFDLLYPQAKIFARFRWDPDLPPPREAINKMLAMKLHRYGDTPVGFTGFNHSAMVCPHGSFRRSRHLLTSRLESCPLSDEWPSSSNAHLSWVMRGGGASMLLERIDDWRMAMTESPSTVRQSVPLALKARRSLTSKDVNFMNDQLKRINVSSLYEKTEDVKIKTVLRNLQDRLRERTSLSYSATTCMQSSLLPLPMLLVIGDLLVFLSLSVLIIFCAWIYFLTGYFLARLSDYIRLPQFISVRPVSLRLYLVSLSPSDPHTL